MFYNYFTTNFKNFKAGSVMRYDNLRAFEKHLKGAAPSHFSPLYAVIGKESYQCQKAISLLEKALCADDFALTSWDGAEVREEELMADLSARSFFSDKRLILIKQSEKLKKSTQMALEALIKKGSLPCYLIFQAATLARPTLFYKLLEKEGVILEFADLKPWEKERQLIEWAGRQAAKQCKVISYAICQRFVKGVGLDQQLIANELNKLFSFTLDKKEITWQEVENICTMNHTDSIWGLNEAIFTKNRYTAFKLIGALLQEGHPFLPLIRQLRSQFSTSLQLWTMLAEGKEEAAITEVFPYMKGHLLEKNFIQVKNYGKESLLKGLLAIDQTELTLKNSQIKI